jgi:translation elongation factor P/translation initiation factor 5A
MPIQKFNDRVKVKVKNDADVWIILEHETIKKGATTKVTGKVKCRNMVTGQVKFFSENACELA